MVGSLLLGLYDKEGLFHHVGFTSALSDSEKPGFTKRVQKLIAPPFRARQSAGATRPVLFVVGHRLGRPSKTIACARASRMLSLGWVRPMPCNDDRAALPLGS
jgi:ATP-dependent DNA ligase